MSDSGSYPTQLFEAENLSDLYNQIRDPEKVRFTWGEPSTIYELSKKFSHAEFMEEIHKEVMKALR